MILATYNIKGGVGIHRAPLLTYAPRSRSARAYRALWSEIQDALA